MKKSLRKFFAVALVAGSLLFSSTADAEIKTCEGTDEYIMSEFETIDIAKQRARQKERVAQEQAGVFVESTTEVVNMMVTKDEVVTMTGGILKVIDVQYQLKPLENGKSLIVRATVKADIDTDDITKWLNRPPQERSDLVAQNLELQKAVAEQDRQLAEKPKEVEQISARFAAEDKIFLSNQQLAEAGKFYYNGDFTNAAELCTKAIELNANNAAAYSIRGAIYYRQQNFNGAIADFDRAIALNPGDFKSYYNRGLAHVKLNDYQAAEQDFSGAIQLNPNDADSFYNRAVCRQRMNNFYGSQQDLARAQALGYSS